MNAAYYQKLLIFAHRGASVRAPENTLAAFRLAAELGTDGIELDVQLTRDGVVVVFHDFKVDNTTDGSGPLNQFTLEQLKGLDTGAWFDPVFKGETIPTLQEVIDEVGSRLLLNIELKTDSLRTNGLEEAVASIVRRNELHEHLIVSSFNPLALRRMHRLEPRIDLGLLHSPDMPIFHRRAWLHWLAPCQAMHPEHSMVDQAYIDWAQQLGYKVNVWTIDDPDEMCRLAQLGANVIITNTPDVARAVLGREAGEDVVT